MSSDTNPRQEAIRRLAEGRIDDWAGLPEACRHEDFAAVLSGGDEAATGLLSGVERDFRYYSSPTPQSDLRAWFDATGDAVLVTIIEPQLSTDVSSLLEHFGPPDRRLDALIGFHADAHQWIYASRGLTLYVREHLNEVARLAAYVPTTADHYECDLGAHDEPHYFS